MTWDRLASRAIVAVLVLCLGGLATHLALRVLRPGWLLGLNAVPGSVPIDEATLDALRRATDVPRLDPEAGRQVAARILRACAERELPTGDEITRDHTDAILCRVLASNDPDGVNALLRRVSPGQIPGSSWLLSNGDWDFGEISLVELLYLASDRPERLHAQTRDHIVERLLVERGVMPQLFVPRSSGLVYDTENHILMREVTRYLRNQWLRSRGDLSTETDNLGSGLEDWLLGTLNHIRLHGFYEFNSIPYETYHLKPLLVLEAFADSERVRTVTRAVLDERLHRWALGTLGLRQCAPFRRQWRRRGEERLALSRMSNLALVWLGRVAEDGSAAFPEPHGFSPSAEAALLPYRPPHSEIELALRKERHYFARIGHGRNASPEIYSGGAGYLLSAGGVFRGLYHKVIPRPTVLLLDDQAATLDGVFHIRGSGGLRSWNNTGVYARLAVGSSPVHVPVGASVAASSGGWRAFRAREDGRLAVVTFSAPDFGLIALFPEADAGESLAAVARSNPDPRTLRSRFIHPSGDVVAYDVDAPAGTWVIESVTGRSLERDVDRWPLLVEETGGAR